MPTLKVKDGDKWLNVFGGGDKNAAIDAHITNNANPHSVTAEQVGLGNVENKSSAMIRGELTKADVTTALGYTPPTSDRTMVREFNTEIMDGLLYTTTSNLSKFYIVTVDLQATNSAESMELFSFTFDYMACSRFGDELTQKMNNTTVTMKIYPAEDKVTFSCANGHIKHICGYY